MSKSTMNDLMLPNVALALEALDSLNIQVSREFPAIKYNPAILEIRIVTKSVDEVYMKLRRWLRREPKWSGHSLHYKQDTWAVPGYGTIGLLRRLSGGREEIILRWQAR